MLGKLKKAIQDNLYKKCIEEYKNELSSQSDPYSLWIRENEQFDSDKKIKSYHSVEILSMEQCGEAFDLSATDKDIIIFKSDCGKLSDRAVATIQCYFEENANIDIAYADEDVCFCKLHGVDNIAKNDKKELKKRIFPWMKPVWSPDTLFSFLYFGNIFAIRAEKYKNIKWLADKDYKKNIYDFILKATEENNNVGHIESVLFHMDKEATDYKSVEEELMHKTAFIGAGTEYDFIREKALERRGLKAEFYLDEKTGLSYPVYEPDEKGLVSIIIPSKDNYEVLKQCIDSVYNKTCYKNFEIIVVDNGSNEYTRTQIESLSNKYGFTYIYEPMDFNFSRMCNIGAKASKGEYILLLNDDMEAIDDMWLTKMVGHASLKHVGAVGAKLLYPNSKLIQHAGITNTTYGPGHKLKQLDDEKSYYFGRNRFIYDMIGVTAACLLVRKAVYENVGGLYENLEVAYNDVDFCFRLYEAGLFNVQRNDVVLYHHESLSRGDDMQDERKLKRLMKEKDVLYQRHPKLYKYDPYLPTLMNSGEHEFHCRWLEGYELVNLSSHGMKLKQGNKLPDISEMNQAIMVVTEDCGKEKFAKEPYYIIKGWAYVPGADNARYKFKLLFCNSEGKVWELPLQKRYRKDVLAILPDEKNVELTGFCNWVYDGDLPAGTYDLWLTAKDSCSRQVLYRSMEKQLMIS